MNIKKLLPATRFSLILLVFNQVNANELKTSELSATVSISSLISDNSTKVALDPIEERQDIYQLGINGDYSNNLLDADINYQLYAQKFADESQPDEEYADGGSTIVLGKENDPLGLELNHSRRMLLKSPEDVPLLENQQEREIISAQPIVRKRISNADRLYVQGRFEDVRYLGDDSNQDSSRNGVSMGWAHAMSKTSAVMLSAQQMKVRFDQFPSADYELASAALAYAVKLRKLDYMVEGGYNEISPEEGDKQHAPAYKFSLGYNAAYHVVTLSASRQITDSSFGNGNQSNPSPVPGNDILSPELGQIDRRNIALDVSTEALCSRCTFSVGASVTDDKYLERDEKTESISWRSAFAYALSRASRLSLRVDSTELDQGSLQFGSQYTMEYLSLEYNYQFLSGFDIKIFSRSEERDDELSDNGYKEKMYGAGIGFVF